MCKQKDSKTQLQRNSNAKCIKTLIIGHGGLVRPSASFRTKRLFRDGPKHAMCTSTLRSQLAHLRSCFRLLSILHMFFLTLSHFWNSACSSPSDEPEGNITLDESSYMFSKSMRRCLRQEKVGSHSIFLALSQDVKLEGGGNSDSL